MSKWFYISIALAVLAVGSALTVWANREAWVPEKVPVHWNAAGEPDQFAERDGLFWYLMLPPGVVVLFLGLTIALPWLSPLKFKIEPFRPTYDYIMGLVIMMMTYLHFVILLAYTQVLNDMGMVKWLVGGMLLFFAAMGNVMGKVKRNMYVGIRTPWTLASDAVWDRTHRLGAWLFVAAGVGGCLAVVVGVHPLIALSPIAVAALAPIFYSLWVYKQLEKQGRLGEP